MTHVLSHPLGKSSDTSYSHNRSNRPVHKSGPTVWGPKTKNPKCINKILLNIFPQKRLGPETKERKSFVLVFGSGPRRAEEATFFFLSLGFFKRRKKIRLYELEMPSMAVMVGMRKENVSDRISGASVFLQREILSVKGHGRATLIKKAGRRWRVNARFRLYSGLAGLCANESET